MAGAKQSLVVWSIYVYVLGAVLLLIPNVLLGVFGIEETEEVWIRVVGVTVIALGVLYTGAVRAHTREMYMAAVWDRYVAVVLLVILAFTTGPWQLALFAAADLAGATWTWMALRSEGRMAAGTSA